MCLFEKKEANTFPQGGTYDQYRRFRGPHPDVFRIYSRAPLLVWRGGAHGSPSAQARSPDQDPGGRTLCPASFRALRGDRLSRRADRAMPEASNVPWKPSTSGSSLLPLPSWRYLGVTSCQLVRRSRAGLAALTAQPIDALRTLFL